MLLRALLWLFVYLHIYIVRIAEYMPMIVIVINPAHHPSSIKSTVKSAIYKYVGI